MIRRIIERVTEVTRRTRIIRRIIIDEFGNERVTEEEVPIEEIEAPAEEDDEDQMVVVGAADESLESPKVPLLTFAARQMRTAHFEYKSDEEEKEEPVVTQEVPAPVEEVSVEVEPELEFKPIVRGRVPSKRIAVRHAEDILSKRKVCLFD